MRDYIIKRIALGVLLVISVSFLVFSLMYMMPGNPVDMVVDRKVSAEKKAEIAHELGYDQPFLTQYKNWVGNAIHGDFGQSTRYKSDVWEIMRERIPYSLKLCTWALILEIVIALPLGLLCAMKKDSWFDRFTVNFSLLMTVVPSFWLGALFILFFGVQLRILPISGYSTPQNYILPVATIVLAGMGGTLRITKTEVLEVLNEKYVTTAYAKGLSKKTVMIKHVLRNALILVTTLVFMSIPWLISGAVVIEKVFALPGMGNLLLNSIIVQDMPVVQAVLLLIAILTVICNLLSDIIIGMLDPRIRASLSGGEN
ncbi:ABC transporter permease [Aminipila luticellarii]|uniref:ABC transporter permease n=1 Tax=Aminipila luticellarii TaxID=2507160 RepID=A0A410PVM6_9FIRM|nr:ABC transporter permease [Aminipila luticellarii]QAT42974.1 ABC transporter permease [Aminipila luticellarii]